MLPEYLHHTKRSLGCFSLLWSVLCFLMDLRHLYNRCSALCACQASFYFDNNRKLFWESKAPHWSTVHKYFDKKKKTCNVSKLLWHSSKIMSASKLMQRKLLVSWCLQKYCSSRFALQTEFWVLHFLRCAMLVRNSGTPAVLTDHDKINNVLHHDHNRHHNRFVDANCQMRFSPNDFWPLFCRGASIRCPKCYLSPRSNPVSVHFHGQLFVGLLHHMSDQIRLFYLNLYLTATQFYQQVKEVI